MVLIIKTAIPTEKRSDVKLRNELMKCRPNIQADTWRAFYVNGTKIIINGTNVLFSKTLEGRWPATAFGGGIVSIGPNNRDKKMVLEGHVMFQLFDDDAEATKRMYLLESIDQIDHKRYHFIFSDELNYKSVLEKGCIFIVFHKVMVSIPGQIHKDNIRVI